MSADPLILALALNLRKLTSHEEYSFDAHSELKQWTLNIATVCGLSSAHSPSHLDRNEISDVLVQTPPQVP